MVRPDRIVEFDDSRCIELAGESPIAVSAVAPRSRPRASSDATMAELIIQYSPDDATAAELRRQVKALAEHGSLVTVDPWRKPLRVVHLALSRLEELSDPVAAAQMREVNNIATYYNIGDKEAADLHSAAQAIVRDARFAVPLGQIATELKVSPPATP